MHSKKIKFPVILSYSMQDIGNSLGLITNTIEQIESIHDLRKTDADLTRMFDLKYELARIHHDIIQVCNLYELDNNDYQIRLDEHSVYDFLEEILIRSESLCESKSLCIELACDEDLVWAFDTHILSSALSNILCNSIRYAKSNIVLYAKVCDGYLRMGIEDDSSGYPTNLHITKEQCETGLDLDRCSIALGLYHALKVACLHVHDDRKGYVEINNNTPLKGGHYAIFVP